MFETPAGRLLGGPVAALEQGVRAWQRQAVDWDMLAEAKPAAPARPQTTIERPAEVRGRGTFFGKSIPFGLAHVRKGMTRSSRSCARAQGTVRVVQNHRGPRPVK